MAEKTYRAKTEFVVRAKRHPMFPVVSDPAINGSTWVSMDLETEVKLNKFYRDADGNRVPNPHYGRVTKRQTVRGYLATNKVINAFEAATNRKLKAAGSKETYKVKEHPYADRVGTSAMLVHKDDGTLYVQYFPLLDDNGKPVVKNTVYLLDGKPIAYDDILGKPAPRKESTVKTKDVGEVVKPPIRNPKIESIKAIRLNKAELHPANM